MAENKSNEQIMEEAIEIDFYGSTLDNAAAELAEQKKKGNNVYIDFNGKKIYSMLDDVDSCYQKVCGCTKAEFEERQRKWHEEYEAREKIEKAEAEAKIPEWIEKGKKYIYPQRILNWKECVPIRAGDLYHGRDLDNALDIMELLENGGSIEEARQMIESQGHSGASYGIVRSMILTFSKRGPEFVRVADPAVLNYPDSVKYIEQIEKENAEYAAHPMTFEEGEAYGLEQKRLAEEQKKTKEVQDEKLVKEFNEELEKFDKMLVSDKVLYLLENGKKQLSEKHQKQWEDAVQHAFSASIFQGLVEFDVVKVIEMLNNGESPEAISKVLDTIDVDYALEDVKRKIIKFSELGKDYFSGKYTGKQMN